LFKKIFLLVFSILLLTGCGSPIIKKSPELAIYDNMVNRSLLFEGNTYRIKEKLRKAKKGEKIVIAYFGDSITNSVVLKNPNDGFAPLSFKKIKDFIGNKANVEYINSAINGSTPVLGNTIINKEILSKKADIIFIEYMALDRTEQIYRASMESLIRTCLNDENKPAIVLIIPCMYKVSLSQDPITQLGKYYNLPVISIANAIHPEVSAGRMKSEEYFSDFVHPTEYGHRLMSDFIMNYIKKAYKNKSKKDYIIPPLMYPQSTFENVKFISAKNIQADNDGSFVRKKTEDKMFPDIIEYLPNTGNKPFEFTLNANNIFLITHIFNNEICNVDIYINSQKTKTLNLEKAIDGNSEIQSFLIYSSDKTGTVKVGIKVPDEESNIDFTEPEKIPEQAENSVKSDDNIISESNFPEEEKVVTVNKKNKIQKNTVPISFYGIGYTQNTEAKKNGGK